eukprot:359727-Chlamydomonas_euryale.AAC.1
MNYLNLRSFAGIRDIPERGKTDAHEKKIRDGQDSNLCGKHQLITIQASLVERVLVSPLNHSGTVADHMHMVTTKQ